MIIPVARRTAEFLVDSELSWIVKGYGKQKAYTEKYSHCSLELLHDSRDPDRMVNYISVGSFVYLSKSLNISSLSRRFVATDKVLDQLFRVERAQVYILH